MSDAFDYDLFVIGAGSGGGAGDGFPLVRRESVRSYHPGDRPHALPRRLVDGQRRAGSSRGARRSAGGAQVRIGSVVPGGRPPPPGGSSCPAAHRSLGSSPCNCFPAGLVVFS